MSKIVISSSKEYCVYTEQGGSSARLVETLREFGERVCIVSDGRVFSLHGEPLVKALTEAGKQTEVFLLPEGEAAKTADRLLALLEFLAESGFCRSDTVVALGGGSVGDLSGFAASCYSRGCRLVIMPTTLLAAVDSSIGGKNGIDLPLAKNLVGTFYQPDAVITDISFFETLSKERLADGFGEVIKTAAIGDGRLFELLESPTAPSLTEITEGCIAVKKRFVEQDEFDGSARRLLNFGHTVAHALEAQGGFTLTHGRAVAAGCAAVAEACAELGICEKATAKRLTDLLIRYCGDISFTCPSSELLKYVEKDKKRKDGYLYPVLIRAIGDCYSQKMTAEEFLNMIARVR